MRCMKYEVYTVLSVNSQSWHAEIESNGVRFNFEVIAELRITKRAVTGDAGNLDENLGLKRILCDSQLSFSNTAGMYLNVA